MTIYAYDYSKIQESFDLRLDEQRNEAVAEKKLYVCGDTGATFGVTVRLRGMIPTKEEPNVFLVYKKDYEGRGAHKYGNACNHQLRFYELDRREITFQNFQQRKLVGIERDENEKLTPIYYSFDEVNEEPIIKEKRGDKQILFFRIDGKCYQAELKKNPLKLMISSEQNWIEESLSKVNKEIPFAIQKGKRGPFGKQLVYLDHPLVFVGKELAFNGKYQPPKERGLYHSRSYGPPADSRIVVEKKEAFSFERDFDTFEEFCYANEDKYKDIRSKLTINDPKLQGKEIPMFQEGDIVKVANPRKEQEPIRDFEGVVKNVWKYRASVEVKFFDYFKADISPLELVLVKRKEKETNKEEKEIGAAN